MSDHKDRVAVAAEILVMGHKSERLVKRLGNKEAIEGVAMQRRQVCDGSRMAGRYAQQGVAPDARKYCTESGPLTGISVDRPRANACLIVISQTEAALISISLPRSAIRSRAFVGNRASSVMAHKAMCVSRSNLTCFGR